MSVSDPIADMLTKVRNAVQARHENVDVPTSKLKLEIVKILKTEGYIKNFKKVQEENKNLIRIVLKYDDSNASVIHGLEKVSKPGRRVYSGYKDLVVAGFDEYVEAYVTILSAINLISDSSSSGPTPTKTRSPFPILPTKLPSTLTEASVTL